MLTSPDLEHWTERGEIFRVNKKSDSEDDLQKGGFTEFPYLLPFGDRHVVMTGTHPVRYWVGHFDKDRFIFVADEREGKLLDYLNPVHCFNPLTVDDKGPGGMARRIIFANHPIAAGQTQGVHWASVHVLPRTLVLAGDRLLQEPVQEIETLRGRHYCRRDVVIRPGTQGLIPEVTGDTLEIVAEFRPSDARRFGLKVRVSDDGKTFTRIFFDAASGDFGVEDNIVEPAPFTELGSGPSYIPKGDPVRMRVFLDKCLLEVFVNGHSCSGLFDTDPDCLGLDLFSEGGMATATSLDIWEMNPAWPLCGSNA